MPFLASPSSLYKEGFINALNEFQHEDLWTDLDRVFLENRFDDYIDELSKNSKGLGLPLGWVPSTEYWLVEGTHFIGRLNIRHKLTKALERFGGHIGYEVRKSERSKGHGKNMLKLALPKVLELGIKRALVTCDSNNLASQAVIKSCSGVFQDEIQLEEREFPTQRYWIDLSP
ncbi:MAG: putative acetyltransferase [Bacteriovoracaceae bacterium]|jgi:predicted acetyltransferase